MKKLILLSAIAASGLFYNTAYAQLRIHVGLNLTPRRVVYAPAPIYDEQAPVCNEAAPVNYSDDNDYFYLPGFDAYYQLSTQRYYYNDGYNWVAAAHLPGYDYTFDVTGQRRYQIHASLPYLHNNYYRAKYGDSNDNQVYNTRDNRSEVNYSQSYNQNHGNRNNNYNRGRNQNNNDSRFVQNRGYRVRIQY